MIEFESVGKTFKDGTSAVVDLNLVVPSGQITVIVGPSGCGKTTTLRMVNRMLEPTTGRIVWDGTPIRSRRKTALRRQMGYVIQSGGLFPHRTVVDNIGTVPSLMRWDKQRIRNRAHELLGSVGLDRKLADRYPAQLSGGQQQRVGVARALAADPLVLLMDEPFSAVDPVVRSELHEFFLGLQRELSKTIILITHDIDEAIKLGDQVAILRVGGKLAQSGTPQQLLDEPADAFVEGFVGRDRGYRSLSFIPASSVQLDRVQAVRDPGTADGEEPALVIDKAAKPLGWVDPHRPGDTLALGSTFDPEKDTLRVALDAALTSPAGLAVAVGKDGRYAGVASAESILRQVAEARATHSESVTIQQSDADDHTTVAPGAESGTEPLTDSVENSTDGPAAAGSVAGGSEAGGSVADGSEAGGSEAGEPSGEPQIAAGPGVGSSAIDGSPDAERTESSGAHVVAGAADHGPGAEPDTSGAPPRERPQPTEPAPQGTTVARDGSPEHGSDEHGSDEHGSDEHGSDEHGSDEHGSDEHGSDEHGSDEHGSDEHAGQPLEYGGPVPEDESETRSETPSDWSIPAQPPAGDLDPQPPATEAGLQAPKDRPQP